MISFSITTIRNDSTYNYPSENIKISKSKSHEIIKICSMFSIDITNIKGYKHANIIYKSAKGTKQYKYDQQNNK